MSNSKTIAWLFPFSKFFENSVPNFILAQELRRNGYKNAFIFCRGALRDYCGPIAAANAKSKKQKDNICKSCISNAEALQKKVQGDFFWMHKKNKRELRKLTREEKNKIADFCRLDNSLDNKTPIFDKKKVKRKYFHAACQSYLNAKNILDKANPSYVISDNSLYANLNVWRFFCERKKTPFYSSVVGPLIGNSFGFLNITKDFSDKWYDEAKTKWAQSNIKKVSKTIQAIIYDHLKILKKSDHYIAYSPKENENHPLFSVISQAKQQNKKVVLLACSSEDEAYICSKISGRYKTLTWIKSQDYLLQWIKRKSSLMPNILFIIRLHPRISKTKRENIESHDFKNKLSILKNMPANVCFDLPPKQASIYTLFKKVDLVLTSWSSVGWEALALGVPSLCLAPERSSYPVDLSSAKVNNYYELEKVLQKESTYKNTSKKIKSAFLWYCFLYQKGLVWLPSVLRKLGEKKQFFEGIRFRLMRLISPVYDIHYFFRKASQQSFSAQKVIRLLETKSVSFFNLN